MPRTNFATELPTELAGSSTRQRGAHTANFVVWAFCFLELIYASEGDALLSLCAAIASCERVVNSSALTAAVRADCEGLWVGV